MTGVVSQEYSAREFATDDLETLTRSPPSKKAIESPSWLNKISKERAEEFLINRLLENLEQLIPENVAQLTIQNRLSVEKISQRQE